LSRGAASRPELPPSPFLYPILDRDTLGSFRPGDLMERLAEAGVRLVQLRAKRCSDAELLPLATEASRVGRELGVAVIVDDRPDVAALAGAAGVHLGQSDLPAARVRRLLPEALIGVSTHDVTQLTAAAHLPVDYRAIGPIYSTATKENPDPVVGLQTLRRARASTAGPLVAIGGICRDNAAEVLRAGADGLAVISDLFRAPDLGTAAREYREILGAASHGL